MNRRTNMIAAGLILLLSLNSWAQESVRRSIEDWEDSLMNCRSQEEAHSVYREAAGSLDAAAHEFVLRRFKTGSVTSQTWICLQAIRESRQFPLSQLVVGLDRRLSDADDRRQLWRGFVASKTWREEAIANLLETIDRHRHDHRSVEIFPVLESALVGAEDSSLRAMKSLLLSLYEDPACAALSGRAFALGLSMPLEHRRDFEVTALINIDSQFALAAARQLLSDEVDGCEVLIVAALYEEPGRFYRAGLEDLLRGPAAAALRLRVLEDIEAADQHLMAVLAPFFITIEAREVDLAANEALLSGGVNARRIAFGRIRRAAFTVSADLIREIIATTSSLATKIAAMDALAAIDGKRSKSRKTLEAFLSSRDDDEFWLRMEALYQAAPNSPELQDFVARELEASANHWERHASHVRVAAVLGANSGLRFAEQALLHPRWQVRLAGIEALTTIGSRRALIPLATATGEPRLRLARQAALGLRRLTGEDFGSQPDAWFNYIASLPAGWSAIAHPEALPPLSRNDPRYATSFYGLDLGSNRVIFVCDASGSMEGAKIENLKVELLQTIDSIDSQGAFNILFFAERLRSLFRQIEPRNPRNLKRAEDFSVRVRADGGTNLWIGLETAFKDLDADTLVVLTDGQPTVGELTGSAEILRAVAQRNRHLRLQIHCVELGMVLSSDFMQRLAAENSGRHLNIH